MVLTTTRVTQMHDIVKMLQDGPESVKKILWSEDPWLGEELEKAWKTHYEVQVADEAPQFFPLELLKT